MNSKRRAQNWRRYSFTLYVPKFEGGRRVVRVGDELDGLRYAAVKRTDGVICRCSPRLEARRLSVLVSAGCPRLTASLPSDRDVIRSR